MQLSKSTIFIVNQLLFLSEVLISEMQIVLPSVTEQH